MDRYYILLLVVCGSLLITITWLVKKGHLREKYTLLWLFIVILLLAAFVSPSFVGQVSNLVGIKYPPTLVFVGAFLGLLLLVLMLSVIDSHQTDRIIKLSQKIGLLESKIDEITNNSKKKNDGR